MTTPWDGGSLKDLGIGNCPDPAVALPGHVALGKEAEGNCLSSSSGPYDLG